MPPDNSGQILEKLGELHGDVRGLRETMLLSNSEVSKKVTTIFNMLNGETPCIIGTLALDARQNIEKHKENHFSWAKQVGVIVGAIGGAIGIIDWIRKSHG